MPVLVTYKFDKDPINNERASVGASFSYYSLRNFSSAGERNTKVNYPNRLEFELI